MTTDGELDICSVKSILFVCMGNLCRSPTAEAVLREKLKALKLKIKIDSAGTASNFFRKKPDPRSIKVAEAYGYTSLSKIRSRKIKTKDFKKFDLILAMDKKNISSLMKRCPEEYQYKIKLFLDFSDDINILEVPDPYYGGGKGFYLVLDLIEEASDGLINQLVSESVS